MSEFHYQEARPGFGSLRITWAVQRLILANVLVLAAQLALQPLLFAVQGVVGGGLGTNLIEWLGFRSDLFLRGQIWQPVTYQFIHGGVLHLFFNMLMLFFFGPDVERTLSTRRFYVFYLLCGAVGVLPNLIPYLLAASRLPAAGAFEVPIPTPLAAVPAPVVGASGAVMGVLVAFAIIDPNRQFYLFPIPAPITARALVIIVVVINIIHSLGDNHVSWITHFGGMGVGYAYMKLLPKYNLWQRQRRRGAGTRGKQSVEEKIGKAVDNIFKFEERDRR